MSLPYEPGRPAFASLRRTADDLSRLAAGHIDELPPRWAELAHPALAHLERALFSDEPPPPVASDGAIRFFEGAGARGALELVGEELLALLRAGTPAERIGIVCPSVERWRAPLETALGTLGVPYAIDGEVRLAQTPLGQAVASLLRFAWLGGTRGDLFTFLRSPFSGLERRAVDFVEGRLRGRAIQTPDRVVEEAEKLRGAPLPALAEIRDADDPIEAVRTLAARMLRSAYGLDGPPAVESSRLDLRAYEALTRLLGELERLAHARRRAVARGPRRGARAADAAPDARRRAGPRRRRRPAPRAHAALRRRLRARAGGGEPAAARLVVAVPRRRQAARTRRARRAAAAARLRSRATATSSTPRARARCSGCTSSARRRRTTAARASRARSGTRCVRCSRRRTSGAGRGAARSRR